jgi:hypothetical protein
MASKHSFITTATRQHEMLLNDEGHAGHKSKVEHTLLNIHNSPTAHACVAHSNTCRQQYHHRQVESPCMILVQQGPAACAGGKSKQQLTAGPINARLKDSQKRNQCKEGCDGVMHETLWKHMSICGCMAQSATFGKISCTVNYFWAGCSSTI